MKFILMADTHGFYPDIPEGDVLLYAGDWSAGRGSIAQTKEFAEYLGDASAGWKIVIAGNHDFAAAKHEGLVRKIFARNGVHYLKDEGLYVRGFGNYSGLYVYGTPWHPKVWGKFELEREDMAAVWDLVPNYTDVLLTHGPPMGILDRTNEKHGNTNAGDAAINERLQEMAIGNLAPKLHVFGHIHEGFGMRPWTEESPTIFVNASICDADYYERNKIVELEIPYVTD